MSPEKIQFLLSQLDRLQLAAEDVARELGFADGQVLAPGMLRPMLATDYLLDMTKRSQSRDAGIIRFICMVMPEPPPEKVQRTADHKGVTKAKGGPPKRAKSAQAA